MAPAHGRTAATLFAVLLCCSLVAGTAAGTVGAQPGGLGDVESEAFEADQTVFIVTVDGNGSAEWTFRYEQRLESDAAVSDFETFAERFNTEGTDSYRNFRARAEGLAAAGENTTGRGMAADSFSRNARVEERSLDGEEFGVVEMSFVWEGFAERDGDRTVVGDVFEGGLYVGPDQQLRFERGPDVRFESADPAPDSVSAGTLAESESVTWAGDSERQFADRRPRVVYVPRDTEQPPSDTDAPGTTEPAEGPTGGGFPMWGAALALVALLGVGGGLAYRSRVRGRSGGGVAAAGAGTTGASGAPGASTGAERQDTDADAAASPAAVPDEELLSDEERVVTLLEEHGGRMKQVDIVDETEWSKSKVSMLLSEMEEEETISKLRVGRENIVSLAGHEPDAAGSPFDDEE